MAVPSSDKIPLGWQAANFSLPDVSGKTYSLSDFKGKKGFLVAFSCNHCPYARAAWPLLIELADRYKDEVPFVAINPNDEVAYPEDSFERMKARASQWGINFPYLRDESQETARAYSAQCTPDVYLFDSQGKLFYHGRINDNWQNPEAVTRHDLKDAIETLLAGKEPSKEQFPSLGCSIKWKKT